MIKQIVVVFLVAFFSCMSCFFAGAQQVQGDNKEHKTGTASYYHTKFEGRKTANGEIFDNDLYTCASNHYKLGTYLKVTNIANKKVVYVKVNDRMGHQGRVIDLTSKAAKDLNFHSKGLAKVKLEEVPHHEGRKQVLAQLEGKPNTGGNQKINEL